MNQATYDKIELAASKLIKIHEHKEDYEFVIDLLDQPYKLALEILDYPTLSDEDCAARLSVNWQTVKQVRKALGSS